MNQITLTHPILKGMYMFFTAALPSRQFLVRVTVLLMIAVFVLPDREAAGYVDQGSGGTTALLLHFNESSGTPVDSSGNSQTVNVNGTPSFVSSGSRFGNAIELDSSPSEYLTVSRNSELNFGTSDFTIEAWVKRTTGGIGSSDSIYNKGDPNNTTGFLFKFGSTNKLQIIARDSSQTGSGSTSSSTSTITDTVTHHVAASVERTTPKATIRFYIDGVLDRETTNNKILTGDLNNTVDARIGRPPTSSGADFNGGLMDELRVWKDLKKAFNAGVVINEIGFNPASGNKFIELVNKGGVTVDAQNYRLVDHSGNTYDVPTGSTHTVDVDDFAVIEIGSGTDTDCSGAATCTWYAPGLTITDTGSIAMYDLDADNDSTAELTASYQSIVDYVAWGTSPTSQAATDAYNAGIWCKSEATGTPFAAVGTGDSSRGVGLLTDGDNDIAVCGSSDWRPDNSTSKGAANNTSPTAVTLSRFSAHPATVAAARPVDLWRLAVVLAVVIWLGIRLRKK